MKVIAYWGGNYVFNGETKRNIRHFDNSEILETNAKNTTIKQNKNIYTLSNENIINIEAE